MSRANPTRPSLLRLSMWMACALLFSGCGSKNQSTIACEEYRNGSIERIIPEFAELVRLDPAYEKYSKAAQQYVFWLEELEKQEQRRYQNPSGYRVEYLGGERELEQAKITLDSFCAN